VWFLQPNRFRWHLGDPPRTIAVRTEDALLIVYPKLKQVERYPIKDVSDPSWSQAMALLEAGFPSDANAFYERYELISITRTGNAWRFELRPAAKEAHRLIERVRFEVSADDFILLATELVFPGGSSMRNEFSDHRLNLNLDKTLFEVQIGEDYQVVNPLKQKNK
jgi:outer membrane lipoprotein-sorting protein